MKMSNLARALPLLLLVGSSGCQSSRAKEEATGIITVTAMAAALPLIPFAGTYGVVASVREKKQTRKLEAILDPVYEERSSMIVKRDPVADAGLAWTNGTRAFLPSLPKGNIFPGLENTEFHLKAGDFAKENYARIEESDFLRYLETLMGRDPLHAQDKNSLYYSDTYKRFLNTTWHYREAFNREIYARQTGRDSMPR